MTEAILRGTGLRTGLYTSPHLARFTERIRVAGREVDGDRLAALDARIVATGVSLTYFEIATVLGFLVFSEDAVDAAVLETGLGGRLDAVTTAEPLATAITSIGLDHMAYLGNTLGEIAREKAGILKPNVPCFLGRLPEEAHREISRRASEVGAPLRHLGADFSPPLGPLGLRGPHQRDNAAIAMALARAVATRLGRPLDDATVAEALEGTTWPGRLERVGPDLLLDCAHNGEGARALAAALPEIAAGRRIVFLMSIAEDKDVRGILSALGPLAYALVATHADSPRALPAAALAAEAARFFSRRAAVADPTAALAEARRRATGGLVVVCGSMFLVGPLRAALLGETVDPQRTSDPLSPDPLSPMRSGR
jgi:dihydrofolate synthase / folylpolyglutamate synthase